jgi:hypothetical protein
MQDKKGIIQLLQWLAKVFRRPDVENDLILASDIVLPLVLLIDGNEMMLILISGCSGSHGVYYI